ncbi:MAG: FAD-dependent monooxygenase [Actinomycetota bacterium]|nr:FAD-dependent monooxygenase [Actinomycetota bacterium]
MKNGNEEDRSGTAGYSVPPLPENIEVAVVGAGPVGLTMATILAAYGVRAVVFDRAAGPARYSRAAVIHARTLETLEPLGVVDEMLHRGVVVPHFGVRDRDRRLLAVDFSELPTLHPYTLMLPQDETEHSLRGALDRQGGVILWEHEVTEVRQDAAGAEIAVRSPQREGRARVRYVVGCDGTHSSVREAVGIPFEGETYPQSFVLADVRMDWRLPDDEVQLFFSPEGLVVVAPLPEGRHRVVATVDDARPEPSLHDIQALLDARGPRTPRTRVENIVWSSRFRVHHRVAARFREGAVFLAGDAAHVHSPAGGQGMNTGIQDAANLAWKLALVLRGRAPGSLLESYDQERRPVAREVVSMTHRLTRLATMRSPALRRLRNVLIPLAGRSGRLPRRLATNLAQLDIAYRDGWSVDSSTALERWAPKGDGTLPHLDPALRLAVPEGHEKRAIAEVARFPGVPVRVASRSGLEEAEIVRPDGYVAGRGSPDDPARLLGLLARRLEA